MTAQRETFMENENAQGMKNQQDAPDSQAMQTESIARAQMMRKIGRKMSILMGVTLSFFLSLQGKKHFLKNNLNYMG